CWRRSMAGQTAGSGCSPTPRTRRPSGSSRADAVRVVHRHPLRAVAQVPPAPSSVLRAPGTDRTFDRIVRQIRGIRVHRHLLPALSLVTAVMMGVCARGQAKTFTVTSAADAGADTLRDAITQANADTTTVGADTIAFAIGQGGVPTIVLASVLPAIARPVVIDGTTQQPGGMVQISGGGTVDGGLLLIGGDSKGGGLVVNGVVAYGSHRAAVRARRGRRC